MKDKDVADVSRKLNMIWNMYDFFTLYAEVDKWEWDGDTSDPTPGLSNLLDIWIISRLHQLEKNIDEHMAVYDIPNALKPVVSFIDDASNWYVRRSRKRFWKSEDDADKSDAYKTLHYVLVRLSIVMAPFTPFLSEELYTKLTGGKSVHLLDWPEVGHVNELIIDSMESIKRAVNEGLSLRAREGIKVRQPLASVSISGAREFIEDADFYRSIIAEELNVKEVKWSTKGDWRVSLDTRLTPQLKREGISREIIRHIQNARKEAGLNVDDRIILSFSTANKELARSVKEYEDVIKHETLAVKFTDKERDYFKKEVEIDGAKLVFSFERSK